MLYDKEGEIVIICGHEWIRIDPNLTQPSSETFTLKEIEEAHGNIPYRHIATNIQQRGL